MTQSLPFFLDLHANSNKYNECLWQFVCAKCILPSKNMNHIHCRSLCMHDALAGTWIAQANQTNQVEFVSRTSLHIRHDRQNIASLAYEDYR